MTRSALDALADALWNFKGGSAEEEADWAISQLREEGWVMVPRELIENASSRLKITDHFSDGEIAEAMLAAIDGVKE